MKKHSFQSVFLSGVVVVLCLFAILWAGGHLSQATAQESGELWDTSAEPAAEMPIESFSPPDSPRFVRQGSAVAAPDALVSWRVVGAALKPRESDVSYTVNGNGSCSYVNAGDATTVWNMTPDLPQGATIDTLRMYYYDTSASNTNAWLTVYDLYGSIVEEWSVSSSGSGGNSFNDSAAIDHVVDYSVYSYLVNWRPNVTGSTLQLCGFRIFYEPPPFGLEFLPLVIKEP